MRLGMALRILLLLAVFLLSTAATKVDLCRKYDGAYISYYEHVFLVKGCQRHAISSQEEIYTLTRRGVVFQTVEAAVIRGIPLADTSKQKKKISPQKLCRSLQGRYITHSYVDIYYVDNCQKRLFPNWEAYQQHVRDRGKQSASITSVNWQEFKTIKTGKDMPFAQTETVLITHGVDVIPIDEACKGLEGKYVSYYSKVYRIKNCHRHPVPENIIRSGKLNISHELTSEQWLSLPTSPKQTPNQG